MLPLFIDFLGLLELSLEDNTLPFLALLAIHQFSLFLTLPDRGLEEPRYMVARRRLVAVIFTLPVVHEHTGVYTPLEFYPSAFCILSTSASHEHTVIPLVVLALVCHSFPRSCTQLGSFISFPLQNSCVFW